MIARKASGGLASLATLMLLLMASLLAAAWAQRNSLNEIRAAANQLHGSSAFEAAEAGLAWAQAMLNDNQTIGSDCKPGAGEASSTFRSRYLQPVDAAGRFAPRTHGAAAAPLRIACVRAPVGWNCSCPADGASPSLPPPGPGLTPMFEVQLAAGQTAGSIDVTSVGCSHVGQPCAPAATQRADANTRMRLTLAFLPALTTPPVATLTTIGDISASAASLGLHNADALSGGLAAHAGGAIDGPAIRISSSPGAALDTALLRHDETLAAISPDQLFSRHFGTDLQAWKNLPGVIRLDCAGNCSSALTNLIESQADVARIAIDGDLQLSGSLQIADRNRPVVLVVDGNLILRGSVQIHGLVFARRMQWDAASADTGALLHGAAVLSQSYSGDGSPDLVFDPVLMLKLKRQSGSWLRVPGSWRDF
ncbi:MAG: hypothetical protein ABI564_12980 [Ideonella sp.]